MTTEATPRTGGAGGTSSLSSCMRSSNPALLLNGDQTLATVVTVHPLVLLSVLDHHTRRQEAHGRVIGTLLGRRNGNMVEVTNCFAVPHAEHGDEVAIGKDFNKTMLQLHRKANRKEVVVGWYASACDVATTNSSTTGFSSTPVGGATNDTPVASSGEGNTQDTTVNATAAPLVADTSSLIHDFYATEAEDGDPVHLVVDTRLIDDSIHIRGYISSPVLIQNEPLANLFHEIKVVVQSSEAEAICLNEMQKEIVINTNNIQKDPVSQLQLNMEQLLHLLQTTLTYVNDVVSGQRPNDPTVGRAISNVLSEVPRILPSSRFETIFHENLQDLLMVTYLSNLTRTQLDVAEKLQNTLGI